MTHSLLNDRYQLEDELGRGGMGVVYRARDTLLERDVAVKLVRTGALGSQGRSRLLQEAQAAASLNHPNIVAVHDAGLADTAPEGDTSAFIVMELVAGPPLSAYASSDLKEALTIGRQIALALEAAHRQGIVHRDLKPENVIVAPHPADETTVQIKLMDFGLARITSRTRLTQEGTFMGTLAYIAPEIIQGQPATPQSDLYSLGILLYELVAGRPPFEADTITATLSQHLYAPVTPPSTYNPRIPAELDDLIGQLLRKEPAKRPDAAARVAQTLGALLQAPAAADTAAVEPLRRLVRGRLVGRERELAEAQTLWQQARTMQGQTLLISGEPGIGKTRLVRELTTLAEVSGGRALIGAAYPETGAPYAPFAQIVRQALRGGPNGLVLPGFVLAEMLELAPELQLDYPDIPPNPPLDAQAGQRRLFDSVTVFAKAVSQEQPLLLVLEDAHWADDGSLALLRHLARRGRRQALLLVATYREVELDQNLPFNQILLDLQRERLAERIKLTRLDRQATKQLLDQLFAEEIAPDFLELIYRETEGNPFFIEEVCKALVESGELYFEEGVWHRPAVDRLLVPQSVRVAIQSRLGVLPDEVQDILQLAAILGREFDFDTLSAAGRWEEDILIDALEQAERAQLIDEVSSARGATYAFAHALIPSTLVEALSGLRRRRLHRQVAAVIERLRPDDWATLAHHYRLAQERDKAGHYLRLAGDQARARFAHDDALRLYGQALEFVQDDEQRFELLLARGAVLHLMADREAEWENVQDLLELGGSLSDDSHWIDALLTQAEYYLETERVKALEPSAQAVELARQLGDPIREGRALRVSGTAAWFAARHQQSRRQLEAAVACLQSADRPSEAAASLHTLSLVLGAQGESEAALEAVQLALTLSRQAGDRLQEATSLRRLAIAYNNARRFEEALPFAQDALALHRQLGDRGEEVNALNVLGLIWSALGEPERALAALQESLKLAEAIEDHTGIQFAIFNIMAHKAQTGDYGEMLRFVRAQLARFQDQADQWLVGQLTWYNAQARWMIGDLEEAIRFTEESLALMEGIQPSDLQAGMTAFLARNLVELGEVEQAQHYMAAAEAIVAESSTALGQTVVDHHRAYISLLQEEQPAEALKLLDQAIAFYQQHNEPMNLMLAYTHKARGHLALNQPAEALAAAEQMLSLLELPMPKLRPPAYWFTYYLVLRALDRDEEANEALSKAYGWVQRIADSFQDDRLRRCWLEQVPDNPRIVAEAAARGVS